MSKIHFDDYTLGLVLSYRVNYGLSVSKTSAILNDIHGIKISQQTIVYYSNATSMLVKSFVNNYKHKLTSSLTVDENYDKVKGKNHYVFERRTPYETYKSIYITFQISMFSKILSTCNLCNSCIQHISSISPSK